jgi:hypothetical protein
MDMGISKQAILDIFVIYDETAPVEGQIDINFIS